MEPKPNHKTVTVRCKSKKRITLTFDGSLLELMQAVGTRLKAEPRMRESEPGILVGIFAIQGSNVVEIFQRDGGQLVGYVFVNLDVWISHPGGVDDE